MTRGGQGDISASPKNSMAAPAQSCAADPNRRVLLWGSVAAVVLLALFGIFSYVQVAAKSREVNQASASLRASGAGPYSMA